VAQLYDFQLEAYNKLRDGYRSGHKRQMLMSPTGSGKTEIAFYIAKSSIDKGKRVVFVADRITLINQTIDRAFKFGIGDVGAVQANHPLRNPKAQFQVCSAQTLARRDWPENVGLVIIDEAHTRGKAWIDYLQNNPEVPAIGLSATPYTAGIGKIFTNLVCAETMSNLTKNGYLVPLEIYTCRQPELSDDFLNSMGEWDEKHVEKEELKIVGDVIEEWKAKANGLKTIAFGRTILYCNELVERFNRQGILAAAFTQHTNEKTRKHLTKAFKEGELKVLVSVDALAKGFDETSIECVIDARPMRKSLSTVQQMWGRGVRRHEGKTKCLLLDFSGNVYRFWPDFEKIYHNGLDKLDDGSKLDTEARKNKKDDDEQRSCPNCGFQPFAKICMECGYEKKASKSNVKEVDGSLSPISIMVRGEKIKQTRESVYLQLCKYAQERNMKLGWAYYKYMDIAKHPPENSWNEGITKKLESVEVGDAIKHYFRVKELRKRFAINSKRKHS
jgi:superfamily II DNA or RNA helicase